MRTRPSRPRPRVCRGRLLCRARRVSPSSSKNDKSNRSFAGTSRAGEYDWRRRRRLSCKFSVIATFQDPRGKEQRPPRRTRNRWSRHTPSSSPPGARPAEAPTRRRVIRADADADGPGSSCSGATACSSGSARAASAWCGALATSCCTARSPSSRFGWGRRGRRAGDARGAGRRAPVAPRDRRPVRGVPRVEDAFYLISELVDGDTLARLIAEDALERRGILRSASPLAAALAHAHARGVIHRDIKPQNVLVPAPPSPSRRRSCSRRPSSPTSAAPASRARRPHPHRRRARDARLHGSRAVRRQRGRRRGRPVLAGARPLRGAVRHQPGPRRHPRRHRAAHRPARSRRCARARRSAARADLARSTPRWHLPPAERGTLESSRTRSSACARARPQALTQAPHPRHAARRLAPPGRGIARAAGAAPCPRGPGAPSRPPRRARGPRSSSPHPQRRPRLALPRGVWLGAARSPWSAGRPSPGGPGCAARCSPRWRPRCCRRCARRAARLRVGWLAAALAPVLGLAGLAGAFPAVAGQAGRWRARARPGRARILVADARRAAAGPAAVARRAAGTPAAPRVGGLARPRRRARRRPRAHPRRAARCARCGRAAAVVCRGSCAGAAPRGPIAAAALWSAAIAAAAPALDAGLTPTGAHAAPRGACWGPCSGRSSRSRRARFAALSDRGA